MEPYWLGFIDQDLPINNLPQQLEGKTLLQVSDIHVGNRFDYQFIIDSFEEAKAFKPDIVAYTGDYVSWESEEQLPQLKEMMAHAVHGSLATVAILGNDDYGKNWQELEVADQITEVLETVGITVLRNQVSEVEGLNIIGIDEWLGTNFDPDQSLAGYQPGKANLALCHNPDVCDLDVWGDYQGWILAGHTHGGNVGYLFMVRPFRPLRTKPTPRVSLTWAADESCTSTGRWVVLGQLG